MHYSLSIACLRFRKIAVVVNALPIAISFARLQQIILRIFFQSDKRELLVRTFEKYMLRGNIQGSNHECHSSYRPHREYRDFKEILFICVMNKGNLKEIFFDI